MDDLLFCYFLTKNSREEFY